MVRYEIWVKVAITKAPPQMIGGNDHSRLSMALIRQAAREARREPRGLITIAEMVNEPPVEPCSRHPPTARRS